MDRAENCGMSVSRYLNKLVDRAELDANGHHGPIAASRRGQADAACRK